MRRTSSLAFGIVFAAAGLGACSSETFRHQRCTSHVACREAMGFGAVCGNDGLCADVTAIPRCTSTYPEDLLSRPDQHRNTIAFASLIDRSSDAHVTRERAARLAVKAANQAGGLEGREFGLVMCDIRQDPTLDNLSRTAAAVSSAKFAVDTLGVSTLIGPSASTDTEQVWQAVRDAGAVVISPAATSPSLTGLEANTSDDNPGLLWRAAPTDALQGRVIAEDMIARKVMHAYVIRESGSYGEGLAGVFADRYRTLGGTLELTSIASDAQAADAARAVPTDDPAEVLFVSSQQAWIVSFLNAAGIEPRYENRNVFLTDAAANQSVISQSTKATALFPRLRGTRPAPRDPGEYVLASFIADYKAEYGGDTPMTATFSAHAYDSAWLAIYGAAWSLYGEGRVYGKGVARGLRHMSQGSDVAILSASWPVVVAAFRAKQSINVRGASGDLDFNAHTREVTAPIEIWTVGADGTKDGAFTMVRVDTRTPEQM